MFAAMLVTVAALAEPSDWYAEPVVTSLQPVQDPFLHRWQDNVTTVMAGRSASPLFRNSAARMDAHWRLAAYDIDRPLLFEEDELRAMEQAGLGALLALQLSADQIIARSPEFSTIQRSLRTVTGPSLVVQKKGDDVKVRLNEGRQNQRADMARIDEPGTRRSSAPSFKKPPGPQLRLSSGMRVVEVTRTDSVGQDYTILRPGLTLSADTTNLGPVNLRLRTALLQERANQLSVDWRAAVRVNTLPQVALLGDIQGNEELPSRLQTGVEWRLPVQRTVTTRVVGSYRVEDAEQKVMLQLSMPMRWHIPNDPGRWPLGQEIDASGPSPLLRRDTGPGSLTQLVPPGVAQEAIATQRAEAEEDEIAMDGGS